MNSARNLLAAVLAILAAPAAAEDWPQFRGPGGQGHSSETDLALSWSEEENIAWKTAIPGIGWSSPVVRKGRIWLTTSLDGGRSLRALAVDGGSGKILHDVEVFRPDEPGNIHGKNSHASPTPVLEEDRAYVHFGANGTACLDGEGRIVWKTALRYSHGHGPGGSPVLFENLLIVSCDGTDVQYVAALDKATGDIAWKSAREGPMAYSTPLAIRAGGADQLVSTGGDRAVAYDPRTGREIWWVRYDGFSLVPRPVHGHGLVFIGTGYNSPTLIAVRPDGEEDATGSRVAWTLRRGAPLNPSPILIGDELYFVSDNGIASCVDARSAELHWQNRLGGKFSASPVHAEGRIYFLDEDGTTTVIAPGKSFEVRSINRLDGRTLASIAVSGGALFLLSDRHLYRIEKPSRR